MSLGAQAQAALDGLAAALREGARRRLLQLSPHLVLLDKAFYHAALKAPLVSWLLEFFVRRHCSGRGLASLSSAELADYVSLGPSAAPPALLQRVGKALAPEPSSLQVKREREPLESRQRAVREPLESRPSRPPLQVLGHSHCAPTP